MTNKPISLGDLLEFFPPMELPITLTSEIHHVFLRENKPIPQALITKFLQPEGEEDDGFTEYAACFRMPGTDQYKAIIFWKASLMSYEYILATYRNNGQLIESRVIGGTKSDGTTLLKRIATIDDDSLILVAEGIGPLDERQYNANQSHTYQLEIAETGDIFQMISEN
ncbi:MAG: hypothetical protein IPL46_07735 [Saprospiraceae bacterium]|nr:hypothetical protein [Saprospiraceae bacterium]